MKSFDLAAPAQRDINEIKSYLVARGGPRVTRRVMENSKNAIAFIGRHPDVGHIREDLMGRQVLANIFLLDRL